MSFAGQNRVIYSEITMIEFICAFAASGLIIKAISDYIFGFERVWLAYGMAAVLGVFIVLPICLIDIPAYLEMKEAERKIREEFKRRANGQH